MVPKGLMGSSICWLRCVVMLTVVRETLIDIIIIIKQWTQKLRFACLPWLTTSMTILKWNQMSIANADVTKRCKLRSKTTQQVTKNPKYAAQSQTLARDQWGSGSGDGFYSQTYSTSTKGRSGSKNGSAQIGHKQTRKNLIRWRKKSLRESKPWLWQISNSNSCFNMVVQIQVCRPLMGKTPLVKILSHPDCKILAFSKCETRSKRILRFMFQVMLYWRTRSCKVVSTNEISKLAIKTVTKSWSCLRRSFGGKRHAFLLRLTLLTHSPLLNALIIRDWALKKFVISWLRAQIQWIKRFQTKRGTNSGSTSVI